MRVHNRLCFLRCLFLGRSRASCAGNKRVDKTEIDRDPFSANITNYIFPSSSFSSYSHTVIIHSCNNIIVRQMGARCQYIYLYSIYMYAYIYTIIYIYARIMHITYRYNIYVIYTYTALYVYVCVYNAI